MSAVRRWPVSIGLAQYADAFETNEIGMDLLSRGDDQMLKDLGVSISQSAASAANPRRDRKTQCLIPAGRSPPRPRPIHPHLPRSAGRSR